MRITVNVDDDEVRRLLRTIGNNGNKVVSQALNKTLNNTRTQVYREVSRESGALQKYVRKVTKTKRATPSKPVAELIMSGWRLPVTAFGARQTKAGVTFRGRRGTRRLIRGAFIQRAPSQGNYRGAWMRKFDRTKTARGVDYKGRHRRGRLPLRKLKAVSVGHVLLSPYVLNHLQRTIAERWSINVNQTLDRLLNNG